MTVLIALVSVGFIDFYVAIVSDVAVGDEARLGWAIIVGDVAVGNETRLGRD